MTVPPAPIGYYGKVPARGDFVGRRLPPDLIGAWDDWLQEAIAASQEALGAGWREIYYVSPLWRFAVPPGTCGGGGLAGVLMPSVDKVGRCYPLMLGSAVESGADLAALASLGEWFDALEELALQSLSEGFDLGDLDRPLPALRQDGRGAHPGPVPVRNLHTPASNVEEAAAWFAASWPAGLPDRSSIWWTSGSERVGPCAVIAAGLPYPEGFAAFLDGEWGLHGWDAAELPSPGQERAPRGEPSFAGWDRED